MIAIMDELLDPKKRAMLWVATIDVDGKPNPQLCKQRPGPIAVAHAHMGLNVDDVFQNLRRALDVDSVRLTKRYRRLGLSDFLCLISTVALAGAVGLSDLRADEKLLWVVLPTLAQYIAAGSFRNVPLVDDVKDFLDSLINVQTVDSVAFNHRFVVAITDRSPAKTSLAVPLAVSIALVFFIGVFVLLGNHHIAIGFGYAGSIFMRWIQNRDYTNQHRSIVHSANADELVTWCTADSKAIHVATKDIESVVIEEDTLIFRTSESSHLIRFGSNRAARAFAREHQRLGKSSTNP